MKRITSIITLILIFAFGTLNAQDLYVSATGWAQWDEVEQAEGYMVSLDGQTEFQISEYFYQHDVTNFVSGETHNIKVAPIIDGNVGDFVSFDWIYTSCEHFEGMLSAPQGEWQGDNIFLSWELPQEPQGGDSFFESFEDGIPDTWAHIDADGDGHFWFLGSVLTPPPLTFFPHSGEDMISSESYSNMVGVGALHPDNYIVTHKLHINEGSTFSFWACARDASYPSEHFGVALSLGSQTEPSDFFMVQEWTLTAKDSRYHGEWHQYSVDLSNFAGLDVYVAIRHFNCTDQFYIDVDDVEFNNGRGNTPTAGILGTFIIRDGEYYDITFGDTRTYIDEAPEQIEHEYTFRVIYYGTQDDYTLFAMSCPESIVVADPTKVNENNDNPLTIFPNPATDAITIQGEGLQHVTLFNSIGQVVLSTEANGNLMHIDLGGFTAGYYILQAQTINGTRSQKISIQ